MVAKSFQKIDGVVFVYDLSEPYSLNKLDKHIIPEVLSKAKIGVKCFLLGNKLDCEKVVTTSVSIN